jgi:pimeloyl-ACP methyl ester carboxylesterase
MAVTPESFSYPEDYRYLNNLQFQLMATGPSNHSIVILLHGFPDLWQGWHLQIASLANAGFRILVPNQRGYGKSEKPRGISAYDIEHLANDVVALADSEGCSTFSIVGHDWGGIIAWWVAARFPQRVARLVILNAPHPGIFQSYLLRHPSQLFKSWYAGFFQLPWIPEAMLAAGNYRLLFRSVRLTSQPGVFDNSDRRYLVAGWSEPGALTAMLNYYRAAARRSQRSLRLRITVPTLILFSKRDPTEEPGLAEASLSLCDHARLVWLERARHWIQREEADRVTEEIIRFISPRSLSTAAP